MLVDFTVNFLNSLDLTAYEVGTATVIIPTSYMKKLGFREFRTLPKVTQLISGIVKVDSQAL